MILFSFSFAHMFNENKIACDFEIGKFEFKKKLSGKFVHKKFTHKMKMKTFWRLCLH